MGDSGSGLKGATCRQASTKERSAGEWAPPGGRRGGSLLGMRNSARMGCRSPSGGAPVASCAWQQGAPQGLPALRLLGGATRLRARPHWAVATARCQVLYRQSREKYTAFQYS